MKTCPHPAAATSGPIAVVALDGISPFHLSVPCLVFGEDRLEDGIPLSEVLVCAERPGRLGTSAGFSIDAPHRAGGQAQFIEQPLPAKTQGDRLGEALDWALGKVGEAPRLDDLAARAPMSRRTFTWRFRERTGTTFNKWIGAQRLAYAQRLLETTDLPVEQVAAQAGFGSALSLRMHFGESLHTSPSAYRREFRGPSTW